MKPLKEPKKDNMNEHAWNDLIQAIRPREISVSVIDGNVMLSGTVNSYSKKVLAEQIVCRVSSVRSIVNTIEVKLPGSEKLKDDVLPDTILNAFVKEFNAPEEEACSI